MGLTLRNAGARRVRGVTLLITSQEFAPGGKGSVARPCIDVPPGENFTLPVDIRLVRPVQQSTGPLVRVQLDGVLFDDLSFFGPNRLNSQRAMTFWEVGSAARPGLFQADPAGEGRGGTAPRDAGQPGPRGQSACSSTWRCRAMDRAVVRGRAGFRTRGAVRFSGASRLAGAAARRLGRDFGK